MDANSKIGFYRSPIFGVLIVGILYKVKSQDFFFASPTCHIEQTKMAASNVLKVNPDYGDWLVPCIIIIVSSN